MTKLGMIGNLFSNTILYLPGLLSRLLASGCPQLLDDDNNWRCVLTVRSVSVLGYPMLVGSKMH